MNTSRGGRYGYVQCLYCGGVFRGVHVCQNLTFPTLNTDGQLHTNCVSRAGSLDVSTWLGRGTQVFGQTPVQMLL